MLAGDFAGDSKQPRLKRAGGLVSMAGFVHGDQRFLAYIFKFGRIGQASAQKARDHWPDVLEQDAESLAISPSGSLHQPRTVCLLLVRHHYTSNCPNLRQSYMSTGPDCTA